MQSRYLTLLPALLLIGCGGGDTAAPKTSSAPKTAAPATETAEMATEAAATMTASSMGGTWDGSQGVAEVSGMIRFGGTAPTPKTLDMGSDAACHSTDTPDPSIIVNNGMLENTVVYVSKGLDDWKFPKNTDPVFLSQAGCMYTPHVLAMQAGQELRIKNGDAVTHNVHSFSKRNPSFNKSQPEGGTEISKMMKRDEKIFAVKCDIHSWMSSYIAVVDNPFFAVSAADGSFTLGSLPAGEYTITAEHEVLGSQKAKVTVSESGAGAVEFTFSQ